MNPTFNEALPLIIAGAVVLVLVIWLLFRLGRSTSVTDRTTGDVLDEGAEKPVRNNALIDAPRSVSQDVGQTSANANSDKVAAAPMQADSEAGASVAPTHSEPAESNVPPVDTPAPSANAAPGDADDLQRLKGVGPKLVAMLHDLGVTRFDQIANWTQADIDRIDPQLGRFSGRIERDQWVEQAKLLGADDDAAYTERFGRN